MIPVLTDILFNSSSAFHFWYFWEEMGDTAQPGTISFTEMKLLTTLTPHFHYFSHAFPLPARGIFQGVP